MGAPTAHLVRFALILLGTSTPCFGGGAWSPPPPPLLPAQHSGCRALQLRYSLGLGSRPATMLLTLAVDAYKAGAVISMRFAGSVLNELVRGPSQRESAQVVVMPAPPQGGTLMQLTLPVALVDHPPLLEYGKVVRGPHTTARRSGVLTMELGASSGTGTGIASLTPELACELYIPVDVEMGRAEESKTPWVLALGLAPPPICRPSALLLSHLCQSPLVLL